MKHYIYIHKDNNDNIFYIGRGCGNRHKQFKHRTYAWQEAAKNGWTSEVILDGLSFEDAVSIEREMITNYDGPLANVQHCNTTNWKSRRTRMLELAQELNNYYEGDINYC